MTLSPQFPGVWHTAPAGYPYFLPASLQAIQNIPLPHPIPTQIQDAALALGEFSSLINRIPNPGLFIHAYTTTEATLSSRIEGTRTNIEDAFKQEADVDPQKRTGIPVSIGEEGVAVSHSLYLNLFRAAAGLLPRARPSA